MISRRMAPARPQPYAIPEESGWLLWYDITAAFAVLVTVATMAVTVHLLQLF